LKEYEPEIAKVMRQNHRGIQRLKARELVPGDVVDVSGKMYSALASLSSSETICGAPFTDKVRTAVHYVASRTEN